MKPSGRCTPVFGRCQQNGPCPGVQRIQRQGMREEEAKSDMADYITTYSGVHFVPTEPEQDAIHIRDIAHALSMICRGNGHVKTFFSVGQHCIYCALEAEARGYSARTILACLLHDASEAYMSDVPRPFKKHLKGYKELEEQLLEVIYAKYLDQPLTEEEKGQIKEIDDDLLYYDLLELLNEPSEGEPPVLKSEISYRVEPFEEIEQRYLALFWKYYHVTVQSPT